MDLFTCAQLASEPPNDPVAVPGPSQPKNRKRIGADGVAILEAYWSSNPNPLQPLPLSDKKELTRKIKEIHGCDYWSVKHTSDWFNRRKKKLQKRDLAQSSQALKLVSPSNDALQHLGVLLTNQPDPSSDVIKTWATLFARDGGSVAVDLWITYITQVVASSRSSDWALPPSANLPTPAGTVTPEPLMQPSGSSGQSLSTSMKHDPVDSPILGSLATPSSPSAEIEAPVLPLTQLPVTSLRAIIADAVTASHHPVDRIRPLPNDADEFVAMFAPYEAKLTRLLHILESEH